VSENRVLRRIFVSRRDDIKRGGRKLHNDDFYNLYYSLNAHWNDQVKEDEMGRACNTHGEKKNAYGIFVGKPEGKTPLGRN
jgi:hypothetical protein